ncbi:MAG: hypothetical protein QM756_44280 [Polyangiaceae bacterium]
MSTRDFLISATGALSIACRAQTTAPPRFEAQGPACAQHQQDLVAFVSKLPERALPTALTVDLPESTIGEVPGIGALLEIDEGSARFDGEALGGATASERALAGGKAVERWLTASAEQRELYVAAARSIDVQTLRTYLAQIPQQVRARWLVRMPAPESPKAAPEREDHEARALADRLLAERDASQRKAIAREGFASFSRCSGVSAVLDQADAAPAQARWPTLRQGLSRAFAECRCDQLSTAGLEQLLVAEQRAGTATLAALPLAFMRDERCGASMPLRSLGKLVEQMERFDAEFAGGWQRDALEFEKVLTDERLLNTFCNALPGETLAQLGRKRATVYWKLSGADGCEAWRLEPLSPGAPMGTLRSTRGGKAFHYWQGAEELRVFGPLTSAASKPTDEHSWPCDQNLRLTAVDAESLEFEHGRWFFAEPSCRAAAAEKSTLEGCITNRGAEP